MQDSYHKRLEELQAEKNAIIYKTTSFANGLNAIQAELQEKEATTQNLKTKLAFAEKRVAALEEQLEESQTDAESYRKNNDEQYIVGRQEATEELSLENKKLRELIEDLRRESREQQRSVKELSFQKAELEKQNSRLEKL